MIQANSYLTFFSTNFLKLEILKIIGASYMDEECKVFTDKVNSFFSQLRILNLSYSSLNSPAIDLLLSAITLPLVELHLSYSKFNVTSIEAINSKLAAKIHKLSIVQAFFYDSQHVKLLLDKMIANPCFDFNYILNQFSHLVSKKLIADILFNYLPLIKQHVLNITEAALTDIDVVYWDISETAKSDYKTN